jgi:hypothetical protein
MASRLITVTHWRLVTFEGPGIANKLGYFATSGCEQARTRLWANRNWLSTGNEMTFD